jgi:hypothetical protein
MGIRSRQRRHRDRAFDARSAVRRAARTLGVDRVDARCLRRSGVAVLDAAEGIPRVVLVRRAGPEIDRVFRRPGAAGVGLDQGEVGMSKTDMRRRLEEAGKAAEDRVKDAGRDAERAVRHAADGITDEIEERTGRPLNRDYMRLALVLAVVVTVVLVVVGVRALFGR